MTPISLAIRLYLLIAAFAGCSAVLLGAFGAHALEAELNAKLMQVWHTAVQYQFWHSLALLFATVLLIKFPSRLLHWACGLYSAGLFLFCTSLYLLVLSGVKSLGIITPIGGIAWVLAWALVFVFAWRLP